MSLKNKFMRSLILCAATLGLIATMTSPTRASDGSDVAIGVFAGLLITSLIYRNRTRQLNNGYVTSNDRYYTGSRYDYGAPGRYNRYDHDWWQSQRYDHNRHNRHTRY